MREGWFKFHRRTFDNPVLCRDPLNIVVWLFLLVEAEYHDVGKRVALKEGEIELKKGQLFKTEVEISKELRISKEKIHRILKLLETEKQIATRKTSRGTLITILKWCDYQKRETDLNQVCNENESSLNQVCNENAISSYLYKNTRIQEDKKEQKKSSEKPKEPKHHYGEYNHVMLTDRQYNKLCDDYGDIETGEAIKYLDEYIQMKGYKAVDHNLVMRKWVFDAVSRDKQKRNTYNSNGNNAGYDWDNI